VSRILPEKWEEVWTDYEILRGRSLSARTLENYRDTVVQLARFLGPVVPTMEAVTRRHVAAFLEHVAQATSGTTAAMRYRGLSAVFRVMSKPDEYGEALLARNPMTGLKPPKTSDVLVPILSLDDAKRLITTCRGSNLRDVRDEAMIRFLYDTGVRRGELVSMRIDPQSLNLREGAATVTGKTGPRIVAFGPKTGAAIFRYIRVRRRGRWRDNTALWIGSRGPLKGNGIFQALDRRFHAARVYAPKKAHIFRRTFSHEWRAKGGQVDDLIALNGWSGPEMALRYGKSAASERARAAHARLSLGERL